MMGRRAIRIGALLLPLAALVGLVGAGPAWAGSLSVMPVRVDVAPTSRFCSLTLGNDSERPVTVQVRAFAWQKDDAGADLLEPDGRFIVNPTIATIAPGATRLVRCSLPARTAVDEAEEQWRLIIDQLPDSSPVAPGTAQTLLRISLPVFRAGEKAAPRLFVTLDKASLRLANSGTRHVKVLAVTLHGADGDAVVTDRSFYLLAGGAQSVTFERLPRGGATGVHVRAEEGEFDVPLASVR